MNDWLHFAEDVVRGWVRLYTLGLEKGARDERRAEIVSDLWEHRNHAAAKGERRATTSLSILGRSVAGIPADLSWRVSQRRRGARTLKESILTNRFGRYWWQVLAALTGLATIYTGARQFFTDEVSVGVNAGKIGGLFLFVGAGAFTLMGLTVYRAQPRRGAIMVMIGVAPAALVGFFGIGIIVGLIASLALGEGWWWMPVGIASAAATASGVGAFGVWWHAARVGGGIRRTVALPLVLVLGGLITASVGLGLGWLTIPMLGLGVVSSLFGVILWNRRDKTAS